MEKRANMGLVRKMRRRAMRRAAGMLVFLSFYLWLELGKFLSFLFFSLALLFAFYSLKAAWRMISLYSEIILIRKKADPLL